MVSSMVDDLESASAPIYPRKSLDNLNESIADTATTHNDDCSMSTAPSDYSSHGMPGTTATICSSNRASSKLMEDINLDEEENENENSMGHVELEDTTNDGCSVKTPDMNDTHHTLEQAEDIDSTGNLSEDSTDRPPSQPATPTANPTKKKKKTAKRRTSGASTSSHSSSVARFTASPKRNTGATASLGTFHTRNTTATTTMNGSSTSFGSNKHHMMMNGSERSSASERSKNAMQRSPSRPTINCAPKRPTRFAAPRRAKSHSNLMVRSSSNRNLNTNNNGKGSSGNLTAKPAMLSPKRAKKGALGAMLDKNRKAAAGKDLLHAVNLLDHDDKDDAASVSSNQSFQSRQSGFYPSDSITAEKIGQLATLDLSIGDHHHHDLGYNSDNRTHHTAPLGRHSNHGFQRPSGVRRKPRSMSFDNSYNKYAKEARLEDLTIKWSTDTPLNTFVKNVNFLQSHLSIARLGKNFGVLGDLVTGKRELTMTTIDEDEDSEEFLEVHRQKQQEHHLATYLQNVSSESRDIALRGEMRNMSSISRKVALKGKTNLGSSSSNSSNSSNGGKGSERSARSWWGF